MAARDLVFDIFAVDRASATFSRVGREAEGMGSKVSTAGKMASEGLLVAGAVAVGFGVKAVKMAGDFDAAITRLTTTAGESPKNLQMVSNGLLDMAGKVGYTAQELAVGMYTVESAGYHGAAGLKVMEAAAKGARVEGADLTAVTDAVSSLLVDYHLNADKAAQVTNVLTAAVGHGKTTFEQLATALPNVAAAGASAKISMSEIAAAIATMTMHGTDAAKAGTYLRQVIGQLEAPSEKAAGTMKSLGINANDLAQTLSSGSGHGLADAIGMVDNAIKTHLTPAGLVALENFKKSKDAAGAYHDVLANLPPTLTTAFGALSHMVGGVKSLQGFLQLGGENLKVYRSNVAAVNEQVAKGGNDVEGYAQQQATLNGKIADAKGAWSALAVEIGHNLTPAAKDLATAFANIATALSHHKTAVTGAIVVTAGLATALIALKAASAAAAVTTALLGGAEATLALRMAAGALVTGDMTGAMAALSIAMDANPIGLVTIAIAALVTGFVLAYKHSTTFRNGVNAAFHGIAAAAEWMWNSVLQPVLHGFVDGLGHVLVAIGSTLQAMRHFVPGAGAAGDAMVAAGHAAEGLASHLNKIGGSASAQIGPVKALAAAIAALHDKTVTIRTVQQASNMSKIVGIAGARASGGPVLGGSTYLVGENGPELFTAPGDGRVISNDEAFKRRKDVRHKGRTNYFTPTEAASAVSSLTSSISSALGLGSNLGAGPVQQVRIALEKYAATVKRDGGSLAEGFQKLSQRLVTSSSSLVQHQKALDADKTSLQNLQQAQTQLVSAVTSQFTGTTFNGGVAADASTGQAYISNLQAQESTMLSNRVNADRFLTDLKTLKAKGISSAAFQQLAQSNDIDLLDQLSQGSRADVAHYSTLLAQQNKSANQLGIYAGTTAYGSQITKQQDLIKKQSDSIDHLNSTIKKLDQRLAGLERGVERGAKAGTKAGVTDKAKSTQHKLRNTPKGSS